MAEKTYNLDFEGYVWENDLPEKAGIYLTYTVKFNEETKRYNLDELVYIGESDKIKSRQAEHYADGDYPKNAKLAYAYSLLAGGEDNRKRCEAAMIYKVQPKWNIQNKKSFNYDTTTVKSAGKHNSVPSELTAYRTV